MASRHRVDTPARRLVGEIMPERSPRMHPAMLTLRTWSRRSSRLKSCLMKAPVSSGCCSRTARKGGCRRSFATRSPCCRCDLIRATLLCFVRGGYGR